MSGKRPQAPAFSLPELDLDELDSSQRATAQLIIPMIPSVVDQVVQRMNESGQVLVRPGSKAANKRLPKPKEAEDADERMKFLVSPVHHRCQRFVLILSCSV